MARDGRRLAFDDPELEQHFIADLVREAPSRARVGLAVGVPFFLVSAGLWAAVVVPDQIVFTLSLMYGVGVPVCVLGICLTWLPGYGRWVWPRPVLMIAMGASFIAVQALHPATPHWFSAGVVVILFLYIYLVARLPFTSTIAATLPLSVAYVMVLARQLEPRLTVHYGILLLISNAFGIWAAYSAERYRRREWLQSREIERLLLNVLPEPIAERLKQSPGVIADSSDEVTVIFADVVGFTPLAATMSPVRLVQILNEIFTRFDELAGKHGVEKIKTIGDAYMAVAGLPEPLTNHADAAADMALAMRAAIDELSAKNEHAIRLRIGLCSGPVVAGVIGVRKFAYDLWGDTVNTAARMEAHGIAGEIQVAEPTYRMLRNRYRFRERGTIEVKGKGPMATWLLDGANDQA